ncbi:MAG: ATP-binding cassette domain-containing protein [Magnetococcales bacterium]|nr:ATP-binding cassette domain-containing protein [Magnetococcales bacterium]MBF0114353.1 ATP-binding cassette domain-containing protein [Magnetococcales bacterium]
MSALLTVQDLTIRFGGVTALQQVDFTVQAGSITALIGPNGAGKTTVFNCVTGFYRANTGSIHLHGGANGGSNLMALLGESLQWSDLWQPKRLGSRLYHKMFGGPHRVNQVGVARTFQNIRLFNALTVMENLLVAQHNQVDSGLLSGLIQSRRFRAQEQAALQRASAWLRFFDLLPEANRLAGELPYGHQRRLEMARALCTQPRLLCLDEPAAGLNPNETKALGRLILTLRDRFDMTILLIEHDMGMVMEISDHLVVLDHGEVIARGTPEEIQRDDRVLAAYLGSEPA